MPPREPPFSIRIPPELLRQLVKAARANKVVVSREILARLEASFEKERKCRGR